MTFFFSNALHAARSRKANVVRAVADASKKSAWAFVDQGMVSLGNFGVNILLARHFAQLGKLDEYGGYWVLMELMFFLNGIQGAILIYPMTIRGAVVDRLELGRMISQSAILTLFTTPLLIFSLALAARVAHIDIHAGFWAGVSLLFWQLQETSRRGLIAHLRFRAACIGDSISYLGQFIAVACLVRWGTLDLAHTFQAVALTSALAWVVQLVQIRLRGTSFRQVILFGRDCWHVGRWILMGNLTGMFNGTLFNWNFAYWAGKEQLGVYYALANMLRPANPLAFAVATLITPSAAKAFREENIARAKSLALRVTMLGLAMLSPLLILLICFPRFSIELAYGQQSAYLKHILDIQMAAAAVLLIYLSTAQGALLAGVERSRQVFFGQLVYAGGFVVIVMPATAIYGLRGAVAAGLVAAALRLLLLQYYLHRLHTEKTEQAAVTPSLCLETSGV